MRRQPSALNLLVGIDKPAGITSHDVVNRVRRAVGERRVGHAGTLDPAATGVMVVGIGQGTRLMGHLSAERKSYVGSVRFGSETDTEDAEGTEVRTAAIPSELLDEKFAQEAVAGLVGSHQQVPPAYSAISVNGERAYARARAGEDVELPARGITIYEAALLAVEPTQDGGVLWHCAFTVSKGTYIRSIARDLGRSLGSAAHLERLRRTVSGMVTLGDCLTLDELAQLGAGGVESRAIDPLRVLGLPARRISEREREDVACGRTIRMGRLLGVDTSSRDGLALSDLARQPAEGESVALFSAARLWGIWQVEGDRLRCNVNFPVGISGVRTREGD